MRSSGSRRSPRASARVGRRPATARVQSREERLSAARHDGHTSHADADGQNHGDDAGAVEQPARPRAAAGDRAASRSACCSRRDLDERSRDAARRRPVVASRSRDFSSHRRLAISTRRDPLISSPAMIAVSNLAKSYGGQTLFEDVSLQFNPGERYGLVGRQRLGQVHLPAHPGRRRDPERGRRSRSRRRRASACCARTTSATRTCPSSTS